MRGNVCIDTIKFSIQSARKNDICQYFFDNGYVLQDEILNFKKILSTKKKQIESNGNVSICKIRETRHRVGTTTTIEFYGLTNYHSSDMKEKYDGYRLFLEYCKDKKILDLLQIKEIHIDIDLNIKSLDLLDIKYKHKQGPKKEINEFNRINFDRESYYLNKIDFYRVLYRDYNGKLIDIEKFRELYNKEIKQFNKGMEPDRWIDELSKIPSKEQLVDDLKKTFKRYSEYIDIKDIFKKFKFLNPLERINKIFETFEKLDWKHKNIRMQEVSKVIKLNNNFQSYYDDKYIYFRKNDINRFIIFDSLKEKLNKFNTTISYKQLDSNDLVVYNKTKKEKLNFDLMRFEFKLRNLKKDKTTITFYQYEEISNIFYKEISKFTISYLDSQERVLKYNSKLESLLTKELDKYFKG